MHLKREDLLAGAMQLQLSRVHFLQADCHPECIVGSDPLWVSTCDTLTSLATLDVTVKAVRGGELNAHGPQRSWLCSPWFLRMPSCYLLPHRVACPAFFPSSALDLFSLVLLFPGVCSLDGASPSMGLLLLWAAPSRGLL